MNTTLIFGVLLIVAGIAFAILAYALLLSRRETPGEVEETPAAIDEAVVEDGEAETAACLPPPRPLRSPSLLPRWPASLPYPLPLRQRSRRTRG